MGLEYRIVSITLKTNSHKTRIQVEYDSGHKEIIKDPCESKFGALLLTHGGTTMETIAAKQSLKRFSRFLLDHEVGVSDGYKCWNMLCAGRDCGIKASRGMLFMPPKDQDVYGNIARSPEEQGHYKAHLTTPIYHMGRITNRIKLSQGIRYLIAGPLGTSSENYRTSSRPSSSCDCGQCSEDGFDRDVEEAIINPLEILSERYQTAQVAGRGIWRPGFRALVIRDDDGTYRIRGYISPGGYSDFICDGCKSVGRITKCGNECLELVAKCRDGSHVDMVEAGSAAVVRPLLEFCPVKFGKVRKALKRVAGRLDTFGLKHGGLVLSNIASLVRATRMEVVFVLNNDMSIVQPIISGANCFLRRDFRGRWNSCETLTGSELNKQIFSIDQDGTWRMVGNGEKYGVSTSDSGNYRLVLGGQNMPYGPHLDNQLFGGPEM